MPFLRFTRDKRGYESTFLIHTVRRRGKARQRILYWFRTPPDVKVGRSALDEAAIRSIEEHNPAVSFDWASILEVQPPPAPPVEDARSRPGRHPKGDLRGPGARQPPEVQSPAARRRDARKPGRSEPAGRGQTDAAGPTIALAVEAIEEPPETVEPVLIREDVRPAVEVVIGREQAAKLRARFAELQARITERGGDPANIEALRLQAESLNPDTWVTSDEAKKGFEEFETRCQEFRRQLGLRKRRRSRRGGVRRRRGVSAGQAPDAAAQGDAPTGNLPAVDLGATGGVARHDDVASDRPAGLDERVSPDNGRDPD